MSGINLPIFMVPDKDPNGPWDPGTLRLTAPGAVAETMDFAIVERSERVRRAGSLCGGEQVCTNRAMYGAPEGIALVQWETDRGFQSSGIKPAIMVVGTVAPQELIQAIKKLRRDTEAITRRVSKTGQDDLLKCASCGIQSMARGGDNQGWKGIQMRPNENNLAWFCTKAPCVEARDKAVIKATENWTYPEV